MLDTHAAAIEHACIDAVDPVDVTTTTEKNIGVCSHCNGSILADIVGKELEGHCDWSDDNAAQL